MSFNPELKLIAKILDTRDMKTVIEKRMEPNQFMDETCAEYLTYLLEYYNSREHPHSVPTREIFKERFPKDFIPESEKDVSIDQLIASARSRQYAQACRQYSDELALAAGSGDPLSVLERVRLSIGDVLGSSGACTEMSLSGCTDAILKHYHGAKSGQIRGIPWPWFRLNQLTQGLERGTYVLIYGRPKQMKSWVANYIGAHFYQTNLDGGKVLMVSMEMPPEIIARRTAALITHVDYEKFMQGRLVGDEEKIMEDCLKELRDVELMDQVRGRTKEFIITFPEGEMNVHGIEARIDALKPDLVIVDGVYLLSDARSKKGGVDWKVLSQVSRDLKQMAHKHNVPIIGVHQANRKQDEDADELEDVAFADNFARDADILIKCIKIETRNYGTLIALLFSGAREFKISGFYIFGKPAVNFTHWGDFASKEELLNFIEKCKKENKTSTSDPSSGLNVHGTYASMSTKYDSKN